MRDLADQQKRLREFLNSPGMQAAIRNAANQQKRVHEFLNSPGMQAAIRNAANQQKRTHEFLNSAGMQGAVHEFLNSPGMQAAIWNAAGQQKRAREFLNSAGMQAAISNAAAQQERIRAALDSPAMRESFERIAEAYRRWDEGERRLLDLLAPRGWAISPSSTLTDLGKLVELADEEGVDAVEAALIAELSPARCREIIEGLYERPSFAAWRAPLDQALVAHEQGLYALSVPVWLIALDGIFLVELGVDRVFSRVHRKKGRALKRLLGSGRAERLLDALVAAIRVVATHLPAGAQLTPGELRRHAIFHGLDPAYGTEKASVQGVLLLEVLHFQLTQMPGPTNGNGS
jgi:hypothetical protein